MKRDLQHKKILVLREHQNAMIGEDKKTFAMILKRDRDDEDLDALALRELDRLCERYAKKRSREELESRWKKVGGE